MMRNKNVQKTLVILFWIAIWYVLALCVDNPVLLVTPDKVLVRIAQLAVTAPFWSAVGASLLRISAGFALGTLAAFLCAAAAYRWRMAEELLKPFINLTKTIPVVSFVVLLLIWWGSSVLAAAISFLVVFPNVYLNVLEGLKNADKQLLEMAQVFGVTRRNRFFYIYLPALRPFVESAFRLSLGMSWKSGVAAEVIGTPAHSVGGQIYLSKIYLDTAGVLAWTAVTIIASLLLEKLVMWLLDCFFAWSPERKPKQNAGYNAQSNAVCGSRYGLKQEAKSVRTEEEGEAEGRKPEEREPGGKKTDAERGNQKDSDDKKNAGKIVLSGVNKTFGEKKVLVNVSTTYEPGKTYYLTSPSGSGKTTLLRILAGLESADSGSVCCPHCSMVFQVDRLCEEYSALQNVVLATGNTGRAKEALSFLLGEENVHEVCSRLSGGMKRRVALARAMEADSAVVLLDEPFTGMDAETRQRAETYIRDRQCGRTLIIATHI